MASPHHDFTVTRESRGRTALRAVEEMDLGSCKARGITPLGERSNVWIPGPGESSPAQRREAQ